MILGDRVNKIEVEVKDRTVYKGMNIGISIKDVKENNKRLEFEYECRMDYPDSAIMTINGVIVAEEDSKKKKKIWESWKKDKTIPKEYLENLLNAINFLASAHGTVIARVVNIRPPIRAPRLTLKEKA